jgi:hypothetical protein
MAKKEMKWDIPKSLSRLKKDIGKCCTIAGCSKPLTHMAGLGSTRLCREDQLNQSAYGGYGRIARPHTFHRSDICTCCGQDINNDTRWNKAQEFFGTVLTTDQVHEVKRRYNHGDHNTRPMDGGDDSAENTNAFCSFCHWVKTVISNDGRKAD